MEKGTEYSRLQSTYASNYDFAHSFTTQQPPKCDVAI